MGDLNWPGLRRGLHYRDVILEVNGQRVYSGREIQRLVERVPVGKNVDYLIAREGRRSTVTVPVTIFTLRDFVNVFLTPFVMGIALWAIGAVVYLLKPDTATTWAFVLLCTSLGSYAVTGFELQSTSYPPWSYYINHVGLSFSCAAGLHLSLLFPERSSFVERYPASHFVPYLLSAVLSYYHVVYFLALTSGKPNSATTIAISSQMLTTIKYTRGYGLIASLALVVSSAYAYWHSQSVLAKQRARVVLLGCGAAFVPTTGVLILVSWTNVTIPFNLIALVVLVFPAAIGFAIARHNLFDVDVYIKRTLGYAIMTVVVGTGYFTVQVVMGRIVLKPVFGDQAETLYPLIFALLVVFFFNPINRRVQEGVDKLFFRKAYDYKATVAAISDSLSHLSDFDTFMSRLLETVRQELFVDRAGLVVADMRHGECRATFLGDQHPWLPKPEEAPRLSLDNPLLQLLARERTLVTKYDVAEEPRYAGIKEACAREFAQVGASLALPLFCQDEFAGALALGYKKSGHFYSREDIELLRTLASMTSSAIEQVREKGQRETLMKLFSKHVSPEVAESLWEQREQFLDGGRPRSQKVIATVLFTDLQGFTGASERMDPEALMTWLNTYMDAIAKTAMEHGGVVDDYFGDGVKVNFGVPVPRTSEAQIRQDAVNGVICALALEQQMRRLNATMKAENLPNLRMRVGIYTGPVVAGSLGSADRLKYTTLGDTVNTAARLESFEKDLFLPHLKDTPCRILIGERTLSYLDNQFRVQEVGELALKGKADKVKVYCVLGSATGV